MSSKNIYSSAQVLWLLGLLLFILFLVYQLGSFLHEPRKINAEIEKIRTQNEKNLAEIERKKQELLYLETPQRIDKEAKIQMKKKQEGEKVLVLVEEKLEILPPPNPESIRDLPPEIPPIEKWKWLLFSQTSF